MILERGPVDTGPSAIDAAVLRLPRRVPQQQRAQKTARLILVAVADLVEEEGRYETFTTAEVAERAGISIGTVYRYATDRVELLNALYPNRHVTLTIEPEPTDD